MPEEFRLPLDLRNSEDLFQCMDILAQARAALSREYPDLAVELAGLSEALLNIAQSEPAAAAHENITVVTKEFNTDIIVDVMTGKDVSIGKN